MLWDISQSGCLSSFPAWSRQRFPSAVHCEDLGGGAPADEPWHREGPSLRPWHPQLSEVHTTPWPWGVPAQVPGRMLLRGAAVGGSAAGLWFPHLLLCLRLCKVCCGLTSLMGLRVDFSICSEFCLLIWSGNSQASYAWKRTQKLLFPDAWETSVESWTLYMTNDEDSG